MLQRMTGDALVQRLSHPGLRHVTGLAGPQKLPEMPAHAKPEVPIPHQGLDMIKSQMYTNGTCMHELTAFNSPSSGYQPLNCGWGVLISGQMYTPQDSIQELQCPPQANTVPPDRYRKIRSLFLRDNRASKATFDLHQLPLSPAQSKGGFPPPTVREF